MTRAPIGRQELGQRVEAKARNLGIATDRVRRWVGASAFFQVLNKAASAGKIRAYAVKGGFAMELRLRGRARASQDIDLVLSIDSDDPTESLRQALAAEWCGFSFRIKSVESAEHVQRVAVQAQYLTGDWCTLKIDLSSVQEFATEDVQSFDLSSIGLRDPDAVACLSREQHVAELLHAITDPNEKNRYRNLVDIVLIETQLGVDYEMLRDAVLVVFEKRAGHHWPPNFALPDEWVSPLEVIVAELEVEYSPAEMAAKVRALIARLVGVTPKMNYEYRFLVMSVPGRVPNVLENAIDQDEGYNIFKRMTETEGWRLSALLQFPNRENTRAMLAVLEKERA